MKKLIILIFIAITFVYDVIAQDVPLKTIPFYFDTKIINKICDSLEIKGVHRFYIFLSKIDNNPYTYLIWHEKEKNYMIRIEDTLILITDIKNIDFLKGDYEKMAVMEKENQLKFMAPLDNDTECSYFIYKSKKMTILIESSNNCLNFVLEKSKESQRSKFISTLKENLQLLNTSNWRFFMKYNRNTN